MGRTIFLFIDILEVMLRSILHHLNIAAQCRQYHVALWTCPPFLFIVMGVVNITGMIGTAVLAQRYSDDPVIVIISVSLMAAFLFVIGNAVVFSFQRLADANRMKSEFVSVVSHQLRSPLSAIKWQLEIMIDQMKGLGETANTIATIKNQNERMITLVNDLLEVNRIEDDRLILRPTLINFSDFVHSIITEYTPLSQQSGVTLAGSIQDDELEVFADEGKLRWVVENLIDNAIRYSEKGKTVSVMVRREGKQVRCEVKDQGIGIPVIDQSRIFTKFFRSSNAVRKRAEGTGLGLFLVKSLVTAMNGDVRFTSQEGNGSTFWFVLPLAQKMNRTQQKVEGVSLTKSDK